jgi:hypothetical protein
VQQGLYRAVPADPQQTAHAMIYLVYLRNIADSAWENRFVRLYTRDKATPFVK